MASNSKLTYKPSLDAFDSIVQIKVGPQKEVFNMHKKLLSDLCGYFQAVLKGKFRESKDQVIELAEDDAEVFCYFQYWAYTGVIGEKAHNHVDIPWHTLAGIYIFAEARCIPALQNATMDLIISKHEFSTRAPIEELHYIYDNTAERAPLRKFLAEWAAHRGFLSKDWFLDRTIYPIDFTIDLSLALYDRIQSKSKLKKDFWADRSAYHVEVVFTSSRQVGSEQH